jgi:hypothetical protein
MVPIVTKVDCENQVKRLIFSQSINKKKESGNSFTDSGRIDINRTTGKQIKTMYRIFSDFFMDSG